MAESYNAFCPAVIYIFRINDISHAGMLKIGMTTLPDDAPLEAAPNSEVLKNAAIARIKQYTKTAAVSFELLHTESAVAHFNKEVFSVSDKKVHEVLLRSGIKRAEFVEEDMGKEWFEVDLETAKRAIAAAKQKRTALTANEITQDQTPISFRPEQLKAINDTCNRFKRANQMLWNAKMRFGKTLSALQVVANCKFRRTIILTHRPVVDKGWYEDFGKIFTFVPVPYRYGSKNKGESLEQMEKDFQAGISNYIYFASMQDLRGSELVGGKFDKNDRVFSIPWDCVIVDEAHEGTQTTLGQNVLNELIKSTTKVLQLSGTPFNLFDQYSTDEIFTWDYVMEQKAKKEWDDTHFGDPNPYAGLPAMNIYTFDLGNLMKHYMDLDVAFNFTEFFRTRDKDGSFVHEKDVRAFLDLLVKEDKESMFPFSNQKFRENFRHTLWMVPGVRSAKALSAMLQQHPVFGYFKIVNVAGDGDEGECKDALELVQKAIKSNDYTITISCGKLTTGVSVPEWTAVMMLAGTFNTAASSYMQTIFRVQTPATIDGKIKENCYVFDFAPDRTLQVIAETAKVSAKAGKTSEKDRTTLGEFLNFCPIIACEGTQMKDRITADQLFAQLKKVYVERVVASGFEDKSLYSEELLKMDDIALKDFEELKKIIGETKANHKTSQVDINSQGLTDEEYEQVEELKKTKKKRKLTPEEEEQLEKLQKAKDNRNAAISILRGISIRMPLLIYGADLTGKIKEVTIDNFTQLVDDVSWEEFMPKGVTKLVFANFRKYYDPDIFLAAGKRILALAKAADQMSVEQRIDQIAAIFNNFRNPDKETVLTPWRVVNMHMADTLGGYCFYNEEYTEMIEEPRPVLHFGVTEKVFRPDAKILEINSKSGLYPLYMAYSLYRAKVKDSLFPTDTIEEQQRIWDDVVANNIFVICKTPMAKSITQRTLLGFRKGKANLVPMEDLIEQVQNNKTELIEKITKGQIFKNLKSMKITAIVGNPPYQETTSSETAQARPLYDKFVSLSKDLKPSYISLIMPSRWYSGGIGLDDFREQMLSDDRMRVLVDFQNASDCFPGVNIGGGICYFLHDENYKGHCKVVNSHVAGTNTAMRPLNEFSIFIKYNQAVSIIKKTTSDSPTLMSIVSSISPFGLSTTVRGSNAKTPHQDIRLFTSKGVSYISESDIPKGKELVDCYKVLLSQLIPGKAGEVGRDGLHPVFATTTQVIKPKDVCTHSYILVGAFDNSEEAKNLLAYMKTLFARFLVYVTLSSIHLTKTNFQFVPLQDFTSASDIDWSKSIPEIDKQLYSKYNLSEDEIDFIEKMIKPIA
jgi:DNA or RNA helicases of superfamily II